MSLIIPGYTKYLKIPELFYSSVTKQKFNFCIDCEKYLLDIDTIYVIEKAIRNYKDFGISDTIFEYAMCIDCQEKIEDSFSESSNMKLDEYVFKNCDWAGRLNEFKEVDDSNILSMTSNCVFKNTRIEKTVEYQLIGWCKGDSLIVHFIPYMICGEAMDEMAGLLSNKTIDIISGFRDEFLDIPPEFDKYIKPKSILI